MRATVLSTLLRNEAPVHVKSSVNSHRPPRLNRLRKNASLLSFGALRCHPESFAVILSEAKNLALPAQDKLREGSRSAYFDGNTKFLLRLRLLQMTASPGFSTASIAPPLNWDEHF